MGFTEKPVSGVGDDGPGDHACVCIMKANDARVKKVGDFIAASKVGSC